MIFKHRCWKKGFPLILITALITQTFPMKVVRAEEADGGICSCEQCSCKNEERKEIVNEDPSETTNNEICACNETDLNQGCVRCGEGCTCCNRYEVAENLVCNHQHDGTCGYAEALSEVPCDMDCKETDSDGMIKHCQECAYAPEAEEQPCMHVHDEKCGFNEAETEIQPEEVTDALENMSELSTEQILNDVEEVTEDERKTIEETNGNSDTDSEKETEAEKSLETEPCTETESDVQEAGSTKEKSEVPEKDSAQQETEAGNEVKTAKTETEKITAQESDSEIDKDDASYDIQSPYCTIKIPSKMMINETTDFEIETSFLKDMENKKVYLAIDGDWAEDCTDCFTLRCSESPDVNFKFKIFIGGILITKAYNSIVLNNSIETQRIKIVSFNGVNQVPAGSYQGNIYFNISYK